MTTAANGDSQRTLGRHSADIQNLQSSSTALWADVRALRRDMDRAKGILAAAMGVAAILGAILAQLARLL